MIRYLPYIDERRGLQCFLEVGETELCGCLGHFVNQTVGEVNGFVRLELVLPILSIEFTFDLVWIVKEAEGRFSTNRSAA